MKIPVCFYLTCDIASQHHTWYVSEVRKADCRPCRSFCFLSMRFFYDIRKLAEGSKRLAPVGKGFCSRFSYLSEAAGRKVSFTRVGCQLKCNALYKRVVRASLENKFSEERLHYPFVKASFGRSGNQLLIPSSSCRRVIVKRLQNPFATSGQADWLTRLQALRVVKETHTKKEDCMVCNPLLLLSLSHKCARMGVRCKSHRIIEHQNIRHSVLCDKLGYRHIEIPEIHQIYLLVIA